MRIDRELQNKILTKLSELYPNHTDRSEWEYFKSVAIDEDTLVANLLYLENHGLIVSGIKFGMSDYIINTGSLKITHRGLDFLLNDGGLSAILNVVTVKFHDDTVQQLAEFINQSVEDPEDKQKFLNQLKQLPADATKHIALELVSKGLSQIPNAVQWLQTALHLGGIRYHFLYI